MPFRNGNRRGGGRPAFLIDLSSIAPNPGLVLHVGFMPKRRIVHRLYTLKDKRKEIRWPAIRKPLSSRSTASALARAAARRRRDRGARIDQGRAARSSRPRRSPAGGNGVFRQRGGEAYEGTGGVIAFVASAR